MINREEISKKSKELKVHTSHVQRDYIHGWLLSGIFTASDLSDHLCLKGGNAFRKGYFKKARYSPDLDFVTEQRISKDYLLNELKSVISFISDKTGVQFDSTRTRVDEKGSIDKDSKLHKARVYFRDFYGKDSPIIIKVKLDVTEFGKIFLDIQEQDLIHQYSDFGSASTKIRCLKLEELLASKLKCLLQRRHSVDLYDFVNATIIRPVIDIDRSEMVETFLRMTVFDSGPRIVEDLLINLPFQILKGLWEKYLVTPIDASIEFDTAKDKFSNIITDLFGDLPVGSSKYAFFPSELRNPIMQAGIDLTMLEISYKGYQRLVEPYSLKYKRRKDGLAREYFYVYDTTGGRSSGPGIKALVYDGFDYIKNTDKKFEPRFEVELSKSGELPENKFFKGSPRRKSFFGSSSRKYVVECPVCGKRFYRKTRSTKLNPHKNKQGFQCMGRHGYHVY